MVKPNINNVNNCVVSQLAQTDDIVNLWNLQVIGIMDLCDLKIQEELEEATVHHFRKTVHINDDGGYKISLQWIENKIVLTTTRKVLKDNYDLPLPSCETMANKMPMMKYSKSAWLMVIKKKLENIQTTIYITGKYLR